MSKTLDILRQLRALPLTQAEISRRTGIPQPRICRWEAGNIPVGADDALRLADLLAESGFLKKQAVVPANKAQAAINNVALQAQEAA